MISMHLPLLVLSFLGTSQAFHFPFARTFRSKTGKASSGVLEQRSETIKNIMANAPQDFLDLYYLDPRTLSYTGPGKSKPTKFRVAMNNAPLRSLPSYLKQPKGPSKKARRFQPLVAAAAIAFFAALAIRPAIARAHYSPFFLDPVSLTYDIPATMILSDQARPKLIAGFQGRIVGLFASTLLVGVALALSTFDGIDYWARVWSKIRETKDGKMSSDEATSKDAAKRSTPGPNKDHYQTAHYLDSLEASSAHDMMEHDPQKTYLDSLSNSEGLTWKDSYKEVKLNEGVRQTENAHQLRNLLQIEQSTHHSSATASQTKSIETELQEHEAMSDEFEESMREAAELKSHELSRTDWLRNNLG